MGHSDKRVDFECGQKKQTNKPSSNSGIYIEALLELPHLALRTLVFLDSFFLKVHGKYRGLGERGKQGLLV